MGAAEFMHKRVLIKPLNELGTAIRYHLDERGDAIIIVVRDSDGEDHCCRLCEIEVQMSSDEIDDLVGVVRE